MVVVVLLLLPCTSVSVRITLTSALCVRGEVIEAALLFMSAAATHRLTKFSLFGTIVSESAARGLCWP